MAIVRGADEFDREAKQIVGTIVVANGIEYILPAIDARTKDGGKTWREVINLQSLDHFSSETYPIPEGFTARTWFKKYCRTIPIEDLYLTGWKIAEKGKQRIHLKRTRDFSHPS